MADPKARTELRGGSRPNLACRLRPGLCFSGFGAVQSVACYLARRRGMGLPPAPPARLCPFSGAAPPPSCDPARGRETGPPARVVRLAASVNGHPLPVDSARVRPYGGCPPLGRP